MIEAQNTINQLLEESRKAEETLDKVNFQTSSYKDKDGKLMNAIYDPSSGAQASKDSYRSWGYAAQTIKNAQADQIFQSFIAHEMINNCIYLICLKFKLEKEYASNIISQISSKRNKYPKIKQALNFGEICAVDDRLEISENLTVRAFGYSRDRTNKIAFKNHVIDASAPCFTSIHSFHLSESFNCLSSLNPSYYVNQYGSVSSYGKPAGPRLFDIFEAKNIAIYLAVLYDNPVMLDLLLEEQAKKENISQINYIAKHALMGLAAGNACIEVVKYFINLGINLEQKFSIDFYHKTIEHLKSLGISDGYSHEKLHHEKNILNNYKESRLELTPLALALCAAPAIEKEKAKEMIKLILNAGANYNAKVVKNWSETHGYYTNQTTTQKSALISLFNFDVTGILDECVKEIREAKHHSKDGKREKPTSLSRHPEATLDSNSNSNSNGSEVSQLRAEVQHLRRENADIKRQMQALLAAVNQLQMNAGVSVTQIASESSQSSNFFNPRGRGSRGRGW